MFTIEQIKKAHSKVKSGSDFPNYIKELKQLGVISYETSVADGHTTYYGVNQYTISSENKYKTLTISENTNSELFKAGLKSHQQGETDYITFCNDCAKSGVEKWYVALTEMICTYFDTKEREVLVERIPS